MQHRTITGKILYTSRKPERMGEERGRENFTFTVHADGKRILRAQCEIEEPSPTVLRDIIYALDENDMPMDCFVRLTIGDRFMGAGLFIMRDGQIECESYGPSIGRALTMARHWRALFSRPRCRDFSASTRKSVGQRKNPRARKTPRSHCHWSSKVPALLGTHKRASKKPSTLARISGAVFDS